MLLRKGHYAATLAILTLGVVTGNASADTKVASRQVKPAAIKIQKDIEYGRVADVSLRLDLYLPGDDQTGLRPGILFIHGGGWSGGDKAEFAKMAEEMAGRGYVAASANYRLAPKHKYPAAVDDVQRAVRWLRQRAAEFRLDSNRIAAMGSSAGGHLASMLGVRDTRDTTVIGEPSSKVQCVVDYFGRMDLTLEPTSTKGFTDYRPAFIGGTKAEAPDLYREASPLTYVDAKTVPFLLVHGSKDTQVQPAQSEKMLAALETAGVEASLLLLAGQGHGFKGIGAQTAWDTAKVFLDRHLLRLAVP